MTIYQILTIFLIFCILGCFSVLFSIKNINNGLKFIIGIFLGFILIYTVLDFPIIQLLRINDIIINFFVAPIQLVFAPLIYLFFRWLVLPEYEFESRDIKLLMPFFLVLVINIIMLTFIALDNISLFSEEEGSSNIFDHNSFSIISSILTIILFFVQFIAYALIMVLLIIKKAKLRQLSNEKDRIVFLWILWLMIIMFIIFSFFGSLSFIIKENGFIFIISLVIKILLLLISGIFVVKIKPIHESFKV